MTKRILIGLLILGVTLGLSGIVSAGGISAGTSEVGLQVGSLIGDDLTDTTVSGKTPQLDDDLVVGISYEYHQLSNVGWEARLVWNGNQVTDTPQGDIDMDVWFLDLNGLYYINPMNPAVFYLTGGVGWAWGDIDQDFSGTVNGQPVTISDSDGITFNVGGGLKYYIQDHWLLRLDARYRYVDELVDPNGDNLNTGEFTAGIGYAF
ncbi:MAG: porin family protein [Nitrospirae bacterium]|nr:porin family protein [Nitrospirota bacterium]